MIILNSFCAWIIVLCSMTFLKIVFEKDKMTRFHVLDRMSIRFGFSFILIAELFIGLEANEPSRPELILNIGICILYMFMNYEYYSKKKW